MSDSRRDGFTFALGVADGYRISFGAMRHFARAYLRLRNPQQPISRRDSGALLAALGNQRQPLLIAVAEYIRAYDRLVEELSILADCSRGLIIEGMREFLADPSTTEDGDPIAFHESERTRLSEAPTDTETSSPARSQVEPASVDPASVDAARP